MSEYRVGRNSLYSSQQQKTRSLVRNRVRSNSKTNCINNRSKWANCSGYFLLQLSLKFETNMKAEIESGLKKPVTSG